MKLTVRIDDITEGMDWDRFEQCKELLLKYGVKPLIGIVPECKDPSLMIQSKKEQFWDYVKKLQEDGWAIAQHGYDHVYVNHNPGMFPVNKNSEYAGLSYEAQYEKIKKGQTILKEHGIQSDIFMAPSHSYDCNTLKALKELGFRYVTDGEQKTLYSFQGLIFIPIILNFRRMKQYVKNNKVTTIVIHTNDISDRVLKRYEEVFKTYQSHLVSYKKVLEEPIGTYSVLEEKKQFLIRRGYQILGTIYGLIRKVKGK